MDTTISFRDWLKRFESHNNPAVARLANIMRTDANLPYVEAVRTGHKVNSTASQVIKIKKYLHEKELDHEGDLSILIDLVDRYRDDPTTKI